MVSPPIVRLSLALLLAGCQGGSLPLPDAHAADASSADAAQPPSSTTTWQPCGMLGQVDQLISLAASADGRFLAAGSAEASIWDLPSGTFVRKILTDGGLQYGFSRDGELLALTGDARSVYRVADGTEAFAVESRAPGCVDWSSAGAISPDRRTLALGSCSFLELHSLDGHGVTRLSSHVFAPGVAYSPSGHFLATSGPELYSADGSLRFWPAQVVPGPGPRDPAFAIESLRDNMVAFSPDAQLLLVSNTIDRPLDPRQPWEARTQLLRTSTGEVVFDFGTALSRHPSFSPDGAWIVAGPALVYVATRAITPLDPGLDLATFLPDGRIAGAGRDGIVRLYCPH
jgi:WD40 repeat protein